MQWELSDILGLSSVLIVTVILLMEAWSAIIL